MKEQLTVNLLKDIKKLEEKYNLSYKEILKILEKKEEIKIPISIFNEKLGSLESIVKYLKDNLNLNYKEISFLTNRKQQPIRTTYLRAKRKHKEDLKIIQDKTIPLETIQDNSLSVLEPFVLFDILKIFV